MFFGHINQLIASTENDQVPSPLAISSDVQSFKPYQVGAGISLACKLRITNYDTFRITCSFHMRINFLNNRLINWPTQTHLS
uniref:Uncharacterized protein n=1 Tax=Arundo donax TaxID=35708 RepID=A0A0A9HDZ7_ARUDO